jgi:hypothetical protein
VETYRNKKKEEPTIVVIEATTQAYKPPRLVNYPYHIYGIVGHKLTNCPRFDEMQSMFKDKGSQSIKSKPVVEVKTIITLINIFFIHIFIHKYHSSMNM